MAAAAAPAVASARGQQGQERGRGRPANSAPPPPTWKPAQLPARMPSAPKGGSFTAASLKLPSTMPKAPRPLHIPVAAPLSNAPNGRTNTGSPRTNAPHGRPSSFLSSSFSFPPPALTQSTRPQIFSCRTLSSTATSHHPPSSFAPSVGAHAAQVPSSSPRHLVRSSSTAHLSTTRPPRVSRSPRPPLLFRRLKTLASRPFPITSSTRPAAPMGRVMVVIAMQRLLALKRMRQSWTSTRQRRQHRRERSRRAES